MNNKLISLCIWKFVPRQEVQTSETLRWRWCCKRELHNFIVFLLLDFSVVITLIVFIRSKFTAVWDKLVLQKFCGTKLLHPFAEHSRFSFSNSLFSVSSWHTKASSSEIYWDFSASFEYPSLQLITGWPFPGDLDSANRRTILGCVRIPPWLVIHVVICWLHWSWNWEKMWY